MPKPIELKRLAVDFGIFVVTSVALLSFFSAFVPYDMDEFLVHAQLARFSHPGSELNTFRESPLKYDLMPTGIWSWLPLLPLLCYEYVGSFPGLLYAPLYALFPEPWSARFIGICLLAIQGWAIAKLVGISWRWSFLMLVLCMPYTYQHIVDFGQLSLQTTSVFLVLLLLRAWASKLHERRAAWLYPVLAGALLFLCFWTRPSYIAILVPLLLVMLHTVIIAWRSGVKRGTLLFHVALCTLTFSVPTHLLFTATYPTGRSYYESLRSVGLSDDRYSIFRIIINTLLLMTEHLTQLASTTKVIQQFPEGLSRWVSSIFWFLVALVLWQGSSNKAHGSNDRQGLPRPTRAIDGYLFLAMVSAILVGFFEVSWAMHHVILIFPFLLLAFALAAKYFKFHQHHFFSSLVLSAIAISNLYLYSLIPHIPPFPDRLRNASEFNRYINEHFSKDRVVAVIDWGFYYTKALYGPKDQVVVWPDSPEEIQKTLSLSRSINRTPIFIGLRTSRPSLERTLGKTLAIEPIPFDTGEWVVMSVEGDLISREP